jgi:hypothetical protein
MAEFHCSYKAIRSRLRTVSSHVNDQIIQGVKEKCNSYQTFLNSFLDLFDLDFAEPLYLQQSPASDSVNGLEYSQWK